VISIANELTRATVASRMTRAREAYQRRRLIDALCSVHPGITTSRPYVLATQLFKLGEFAGVDDQERAISAARSAARSATGRLAHAEAVQWLERAVEVSRAVEDHAAVALDLMVELGEARWRAGLPDARRSLTDAGQRAAAAGRRDLVVTAALGANRGFFTRTADVDGELVGLLSIALESVDSSEFGTRAQLLARLASELTWSSEGERRFGMSDEALALARQANEPRVLALVLGLRLLTISAADTLEDRLRDSEELVRLAEGIDDPFLRFHASFQRCGPLLEVGDTHSVSHYLDRALAHASRLGLAEMRWLVQFSRAGLLLMTGQLTGAEAAATEALELGVTADRRKEAVAFYAEQVCEIRRLQGRLNELGDDVRRAARHRRLDPVHAGMRFLCDLDRNAADELIGEILERGALRPRRDMAERAALDNLAYVAVRNGRADALATLNEALEPFGASFGHAATAHPCGHHYLGMIAGARGDARRAAAHFSAALDLEARSECPFLFVETVLEWHDSAANSTSARSVGKEKYERAREYLHGRGATGLERALAARMP